MSIRVNNVVILFSIWSSQSVSKLRANKIGTVHGRLIVGTAEKIPPSELLDTTGAGDAFIGAVLYGVLKHSHQSLSFCIRLCTIANYPIILPFLLNMGLLLLFYFILFYFFCDVAICTNMPAEKMLSFASQVVSLDFTDYKCSLFMAFAFMWILFCRLPPAVGAWVLELHFRIAQIHVWHHFWVEFQGIIPHFQLFLHKICYDGFCKYIVISAIFMPLVEKNCLKH